MLKRTLLIVAVSALTTQAAQPVVKLIADDTPISESCRIEIPPGTIIEDKNGDGVLHVNAPGIVVEFADDAVLRGLPMDRRPDEYKGYAIRLNGHKNVTIRNARISGYWCGVWASKADGLTLEKIDASDNRRAYLKSTPTAEDGGDWLWPHNNDQKEWLTNYGAAMYVEESANVTVRECKVWHGQNALVIDRVRDSKIYDNDFSFNSGWGIAMWRSEGNVISRNAIDFCVRGYSHGVYNRGQDSAGILMFEQNNRNIIAENSVTHGGDCFFGFAGKEAIGDVGEHPAEWYKQRGNSDNILVGNDLSYSPAHGIEMTFSFGNKFIGNRIVENAICGVWGGYSQDTVIAANHFEANGEMGYGLERGGVNIEHGKDNRIVKNTFLNNKCGVHLWGGPNVAFAQKSWGKVNGIDSTGNLIAANEFTGEQVVFHFRGPGDVTLGSNVMRNVGREMVVEGGHNAERAKVELESTEVQLPPLPGTNRPVGARARLRGRQNIIMTEWGPWDHASPLVRMVKSGGNERVYEMHQMPAELTVNLEAKELVGVLSFVGQAGSPARYSLRPNRPGVHPYVLRIKGGEYQQEIRDTLMAVRWDATFFTWTKETDPREKLEAWRKLAGGEAAVRVPLEELTLKYAMGGPGNLKISDRLKGLGSDNFGLIATTKLLLPKGKWRFRTTSDDGVRVMVDGKPVIENWTWHVPTVNEGVVELGEEKTVEIVVEHFEIDGFATLELMISPGK